MNFDLNEELLEPDKSETDTSDFNVSAPLAPWEELDEGIRLTDTVAKTSGGNPDVSIWNTHGVVHVRLLCAQRLPCPVGSSVCASLSLPPYKGRVKSRRKNAFLVSLDHGVCVQWSRPPDRDDIDNDENDDDGLCSMVNGWSSSDSPVPSIKIDLLFSPLGMGLFDFTMATVELSCTVLLKNPGFWRERWVQMEIPSTLQSGSGIDNSSNAYFHRYPLVKIQAVFTPSTPSSGESKNSSGLFGYNSRTPKPVPPPPSKAPAAVVLLKDEGEKVRPEMATVDDTQSRKAREHIFERRNSDETLSLSALDGVRSKKIARDSQNRRELRIPEEDGTEADESMTSVALDSDFPLDSPISLYEADDSSIVSKTVQTQSTLEPHLLRAETYWVPGTCAVCDRVLIGRSGGFHCEQCGIDCCGDCRLNVDIRVPCGSDLAQDFVEKTQKNKLSFSGLLNYVAPDEVFEQKRTEDSSIHNMRRNVTNDMIRVRNDSAHSETENQNSVVSIGCFRVEIVNACLFQQNLHGWNEMPVGSNEEESFDGRTPVSALKKGDYYVRVSTTESEKSLRTPTLQNTGMPHFQSSEMIFSLSHYGVQFRIDVVEANSDSIVGSALLTTQGVLQDQRDSYITENGARLFQLVKGPIPFQGKRKMRLDLRNGIKAGAIDDFFSVPSKRGTDKTGAISGWIQIKAGLEEFNTSLYGSRPIECPNRPPAELKIGNFSVHISRIKAIIEDLKDVVAEYNHVVSWKNPLLTAISLYFFVWFCLAFNAEYSGSLPILFLLFLSVYYSYRRRRGKTKNKYIQEEIESIQRVEGNSRKYTLYRPKGTLAVSVTKGRSLLSKDFGISGRVSCHVHFDPTRYADEKAREILVRADKSASTPLEIGSTSTKYTAYPDWDNLIESTANKRLKQLIPMVDQQFPDSSGTDATNEDMALTELSFPVLQPFEITSSEKDDQGRFVDGKLKPWETSKGAIVFQVKFQDFLNNLPGFDHALGEVVFPLAELVKIRQISGWFKIMDVGKNMAVPLDDLDFSGERLEGNSGPPRIYLSMKWAAPSDASGTEADESERELSHEIQEELVRSSQLSRESRFDFVGSSIGAVNTALGIGGTVQVIQNTLGSALDVLEAAINAFNFTDPFKSSVIFTGLLVVWLVLLLIPTRYIVLAVGLAQYVATFMARFGEDFGLISKRKTRTQSTVPGHISASPNERPLSVAKGENFSSIVVLWITNALRSLPTNEDLRKAYFWESIRLGAEQAEKHASEKRASRLQKLWKSKWYSHVYLLFHEEEGNVWVFYKEPCFAVIQGHRFVWWYSVHDFDNGEPPDGKLLLAGHAGLGGPSPLEMRELSGEELPLCISIFGRGQGEQQKVVMILPDAGTKEALESAVSESFSFKND